MNTYTALLGVVHVLLCVTLATICICRLNHDVCRQYKRTRLRVLLIMAAALLSLGQLFIFGTRATPTESLLVLAMVVSMVLNAGRWMTSYTPPAEMPDNEFPPYQANPERSTP